MRKVELPRYEVPQVSTYTDEEILGELGEAQAYNCVTTSTNPTPICG